MKRWLEVITGRLKRRALPAETFLEGMGDAVLVLRWDTLTFLYANPAAEELLGYSPGELRGMSVEKIHPSEQKDLILENIDDAMHARPALRLVRWFQRKDGSRFQGEIVVRRICHDGLTCLIGTIRNLTDQQETQRQWEQLVEQSPAGIYRVEHDYQLTFVNRAFAKMFGYDSPEKMLAEVKRVDDLAASDDVNDLVRGKLWRDGEIKNLLCHSRRRDGSTFWFSNTARMRLGNDQQSSYVEGFAFDVTEQVQTRRQLQQSEEQLRLILENSSDGINIKEYDPATERTKLILYNKRFLEMTGMTEEELLENQEHLPYCMSYEDPQAARAAWKRSIEGLEPYTGRASWKRSDGKENYIEWTACPIRIAGVIYIIGVDRDITQRVLDDRQRQARREDLEEQVALRTSQLKRANVTLNNRLRAEQAVAAASQILLAEPDKPDALNRALEHLRVGVSACRTYVFGNSELPGKGLCMSQLAEAVAPGVSVEIDNPELQNLPYRPQFSRWPDLLSVGLPIAGPVTEFPDAECGILQSQNIQSLLVLPIFLEGRWWGFIGFDDTREPRVWGEDAITLLRTGADLLGAFYALRQAQQFLRESEDRYRQFSELTSDLAYELEVDEHGGVHMAWGSQAVRDVTGYTWAELHKIGGGDALVHPDDQDIIRQRRERVFSGHDDNSEFRIIAKDGGIRWLRDHVRSITDPQTGRVERVLAAAQDITERKQAEQNIRHARRQLRTLTARLGTAQERERRRIAEGLHDHVSQNLSVAKLTLQRLGLKLQDPDTRQPLDMAVEAIKTSIQEVKALTFELTPTLLFQLGFEKAAGWLAERFTQRYGLEVELTTDGTPKPMNDDLRSFLYRALRELLLNVVKHASARTVRIHISRAFRELHLLVEDDGTGLAERSDPDEPGESPRGFGLFSLREHLADLGGSLELSSAPGGGTRVALRVPLWEQTDTPPLKGHPHEHFRVDR